MLYARNKSVLKEVAKKIATNNIEIFKSQNDLYIFIEDIKNPFLKSVRRGTNKLQYMPVNYTPIVNVLLELGFLQKNPNRNKIEYIVTYCK